MLRLCAIALAAALALAACGGSDPPGREAAEDPPAARGEGAPRPPERGERRRQQPPKRERGPGARDDVVARVVDGDTVELRELGRVRLIGVDTPEVHGGAECYGHEASAFTKGRLPPGTRVTYDWGLERRDRYGRALVYLYRGTSMFNAELVRRGYALPLTIPPNVDHADRFVGLARRARELGRGLWAEDACADEHAGAVVGGPGRRPRNPRSARCADFATRAEAQRYYRRNPEATQLDGDGDGRACETLP